MTTYNKQLTQLGFSANEASIYQALLELGEATVLGIAKRAKFKRTTVYPGLKNLVEQGLVQKTTKKRKQLYFVENVQAIQDRMADKMTLALQLIPKLQELHNIFPSQIKITYYEGEGAMRNFYKKILNSLSAGDEIYELIGAEDFEKKVVEPLYSSYPSERTKKKISIKTIATRTKVSEQWKKEAQKYLRTVSLVDKGKLRGSANLQIYKYGIGIISYKEDWVGVVIESKEISALLLSSFELLWQSINY